MEFPINRRKADDSYCASTVSDTNRSGPKETHVVIPPEHYSFTLWTTGLCLVGGLVTHLTGASELTFPLLAFGFLTIVAEWFTNGDRA
jgi:hypothetical protein